MEYRMLPHGGEKISVIGLGMGSIHNAGEAEMRWRHDRQQHVWKAANKSK